MTVRALVEMTTPCKRLLFQIGKTYHQQQTETLQAKAVTISSWQKSDSTAVGCSSEQQRQRLRAAVRGGGGATGRDAVNHIIFTF
jgi:hypothetical protein